MVHCDVNGMALIRVAIAQCMPLSACTCISDTAHADTCDNDVVFFSMYTLFLIQSQTAKGS